MIPVKPTLTLTKSMAPLDQPMTLLMRDAHPLSLLLRDASETGT